MNQYEVKLCLAICDQSQFQAILALEFNGYFTRIQMFDAKNQEKRNMAGRCPWQPFHSLTLHIDRVDTKDWHYFKLLAGTCVCGATSTSVTCNSSHFWHSELKMLTQSWKTLGTWRCPQHKLDQQSPSGESLSTTSAKQYEAAMRNAMQCYAMLVRCQTVKVSHCLMAVKAFVTRLCAWMIW